MSHLHPSELASATAFLNRHRDPKQEEDFDQKFQAAQHIEGLLDMIQQGRPINAKPIEVVRSIGNTAGRLLKIVAPGAVIDTHLTQREKGTAQQLITAHKQGWLIEGLGVRPAHTTKLVGPGTMGLVVTMPETTVAGAVTADGKLYTIPLAPAESGPIVVRARDLVQPFSAVFQSESLCDPEPIIDTGLLADRLEAIAAYNIE